MIVFRGSFAYFASMLRRLSTLLAVLLAPYPMLAATLADDSARVAQIWGFRLAGDTLAAESLLTSRSLPSSPEWESLANFLSACFAYSDSNIALVPTLLDLGVPPDLEDHAAWLRARSLTQLGQPHLAGIYWRRLLSSSLPDYRDLAAEQLFEDARAMGSLDTLNSLASAARTNQVAVGIRQAIDLEITKFLSLTGKHSEATTLLRSAYLNSPATSQGKEAKRRLSSYAVTYGFTPPDPGWSGEWAEIERLERAGMRNDALDRLSVLRSRGRYAAYDEQMIAMQARLSVALRRHDDALRFAQQHIKQFPESSFRDEMLWCVVRSAYLKDQDQLAISTAQELARSGTDKSRVGESWRLIALLHIDRNNLLEAANAAGKWYEAAQGAGGADDALWMRGWTRYLSAKYESAASDFVRLVRNYPESGYVPIGLYWAAKSFSEIGNREMRDSLCTELLSRFPFSYYALQSCSLSDLPTPVRRDMRVLNLNEVFTLGESHTRAFAQLTALGLWEFALREWPQVEAECGKRADLAWWRPLLYWKNGDRFESWKWVIKEFRNEASSVGSRPAEFYELWYPLDYEPLLLDMCRRYDVDPYLALGVICQESHFDEKVVSPSGAVGLMQLMPETARLQVKRMGQVLREEELYHGPRNLEIGIAHIADLQRSLNGDIILTLCAYNAGINAAKRWQSEFGNFPPDVFVELIPYRETRLYVKHILQHIAAYRRVYPDLKPASPDSEQ